MTKRLADRIGPTGRLLATDLSQGMIDDLRSRLNGSRYAHVEATRMVAEDLDVPDDAFDTAICALGLMYAPNPAAALTEMERVVSPGGTIAATVWGERRNCGWAKVFPIVDARVASEVCPMFFGTGVSGALVRFIPDCRARTERGAPALRDAGLCFGRRHRGRRSPQGAGRAYRPEIQR